MQSKTFVQTFWVQIKTFVQTCLVQSQSLVQTFWMQSNTFVQILWLQSKIFLPGCEEILLFRHFKVKSKTICYEARLLLKLFGCDARHFSSNILNAKKDFCWNTLNAKKEILLWFIWILFKHFSCKARVFLKHFGFKARLLFKYFTFKGRLLL